MARAIGKLSALKVTRTNAPGMYSDGGGLYLRVTKERNKSWVFRFMLAGKARWMGIGPLHIVSLADARSRAAECRTLHHNNIDPIEARRAERQRTSLDAARTVTFAQCAATYIASHRAGWRNAKHAAQWEATLKTYAEPVIESWTRKFEQVDKWSFCLRAAMMAANRRDYEQKTAPEPHTGFQGQGGACRHQG
jgi:Arm DNA-binding domain